MRYDLVTGKFVDFSGREFNDMRVTICKSRRVIRPDGKPGQPGAKVRPQHKGPKIHRGLQRTCMTCNPLRAEHFRRLEEKFNKMRAR